MGLPPDESGAQSLALVLATLVGGRGINAWRKRTATMTPATTTSVEDQKTTTGTSLTTTTKTTVATATSAREG